MIKECSFIQSTFLPLKGTAKQNFLLLKAKFCLASRIAHLTLAWLRSCILTALSCLPLLLASGCVSFPVAEIDRAITEFDRAIEALSQESADWRIVVTDLQEEVSEDMQSTIRNEVENLTRSAVLTASAELRCNSEFMRIKLERELRSIRNDLAAQFNALIATGYNIPLLPEKSPEPFICSAVPSAVDLNLDYERRVKIDIFGFDLRSKMIDVDLITYGNLLAKEKVGIAQFRREVDNLRAQRDMGLAGPQLQTSTFVLERPSSRIRKDVSSALSIISDFHAVLDLTESGAEITPNAQVIVLSWNGKTQSEIPVLAHQQVLECDVIEKVIDSADQNFTPALYHHNQCGGEDMDRDYSGNGPCVVFKMSLGLDPARQKLTADYSMEAYECPDDYRSWDGDCTYAYSTKKTILYNAEENEKILGFDVNSFFEHKYIDDDHSVDKSSFAGKEPVEYLHYVGDTWGDEAGTETGVK